MLCLSGCAVDSGAATRLQRGAPAETVIKTVGQRGQFAFLVQLDDGVYEGRLYRVGSADLPYYFIYRNGVLWKITPWRYWDDNFRTASTRLAATEDWPTSCMSELHQILQHSDCRSFPANYSPLLYFPWAAGVCIGVPCAGIILFPFVIGDLVQEPGYAGIVGKFDPEKVYLEESIQDLDRQLGPPTELRRPTADHGSSDGDWRYYNPQLPPTSAKVLLFRGAGILVIQTREGKVTAVFSYDRY